MSEQPEVMVRCKCCKRVRAGDATALLRVVGVPGGWQVYRPTRLPAPMPVWELGVAGRSELGVTTVLGDENGVNPYPWVRWDYVRDPPRCMLVRCRGCRRAAVPVRWRQQAERGRQQPAAATPTSSGYRSPSRRL
jgi:hypothetical protein